MKVVRISNNVGEKAKTVALGGAFALMILGVGKDYIVGQAYRKN